MRPPHPVQRFEGTPRKAPVGVPHAPATPSTALRGPSRAPRKAPLGVPHASATPSTALRDPNGEVHRSPP
eukprot:1005427-Pyramimonas_sp.AAC.1